MLICVAFFTLTERKVMASIQRRKGPNVTGYFGSAQAVSDGVKLLTKEIIVIKKANVNLYLSSPVFVFFCSFIPWLFIPFNKHTIIFDFNFSILIFFAISSVGIYGIFFAGWSSNSKYPILGSIRTVVQLVSYELVLSLLFSIIIVVISSFSFLDIFRVPFSLINCFPFLFFIFITSSFAETNRLPFDLPEAEAELVAGFNSEYSGIGFALFFLGEYLNIILMSFLTTLIFFSDSNIFLQFKFLNFNSISYFNEVLNHQVNQLIMLFKLNINTYLFVSIFQFVFIFIRSTCPRFKYSNLIDLC